MPFSKIVNRRRSRFGGVEREEQGRFNSLYFGHIKLLRPGGYCDRNVKRGYPSLRWWVVMPMVVVDHQCGW